MNTPQEFEQEVRRIARHRWPAAEYSGSEVVHGKERDGIFIIEDFVHLVECTTSREKAKAEKDLGKLLEMFKKYRATHPDKAVKCWFVTKYEPTHDQRGCLQTLKNVPEGVFNILSFAQFQAKLVDSLEYLQLRETHKFGSIYDPKTGSTTANVKYVEAGLRFNGDPETRSAEFVANSCLVGERFTLLGEYGVGKSMTLRQIFRHLARAHREAKTHLFPIYLNLREHQGQPDPVEMLERHARSIGFANPSQLVRAWKAGYAVLLLDGFDEVSSQGLQEAWRRLRDARSASMSGLRRLITESPNTCGIVLAGREHFFDTEDERKKALAQNETWKEIRLDEFGESQIAELIKQFGFTGEIPAWIPSRPLLLSTLFARGLSADATAKLSSVSDPAYGWNLLIEEVCNREARIESGISGENVRAILEALATLARTKDSGLGPLAVDDIVKAFQNECSFTPNDAALAVLQRLPGLGRNPTTNDESRTFVDLEFADACRAGDFQRFCAQPFDEIHERRLSSCRCAIGPIGTGIAAIKLEQVQFNEGKLIGAVRATDRWQSGAGATPADLVHLAVRMGLALKEPVRIAGIQIDRVECDGQRHDMGNVSFEDCFIGSVELSKETGQDECPHFKGCLIQEVEGRISSDDLPQDRFSDCIVEVFQSAAGTTNLVLALNIPVGARVLVSVMKKLFVQSLSGRKENALYRGLDGGHQAKVKDVLVVLHREGLVLKSERAGDPVWIPVRRQRPRVLRMISTPSTSNDSAMIAARKL